MLIRRPTVAYCPIGLLQETPAVPSSFQQANWVAFPFKPPQRSDLVDQPVIPPPAADVTSVSTGGEGIKSLEPVGEPWYVGKVTRQKAETLLQYDGDFLVRASTQQPNQFVLSGMQNGKKRHLLLINPEGQVRSLSSLSGNDSSLRALSVA